MNFENFPLTLGTAGGSVPRQLALGQHALYYFSVHVCEPEVAALKLKCQLCVIDAQAVKNGGLQIVDIHRILGDVVAVIVRCAIGDAWLDAAAGHPDGKASGVMIAAIIVGSQFALAVHGTAEFPAPDD